LLRRVVVEPNIIHASAVERPFVIAVNPLIEHDEVVEHAHQWNLGSNCRFLVHRLLAGLAKSGICRMPPGSCTNIGLANAIAANNPASLAENCHPLLKCSS